MIEAAGGAVVRDGLILVVHRARYDDWSLPKGKVEPGESWATAALREVREETGFACTLGEPLGATFYAPGGREKEVRWFRMEPDGDPHETDGEVDELRWVALEEAPALLTYEGDRDVVARLR